MRYILIDRLLELEPGVQVVAERTFRPDDELFSDHFPGCPIVPGALLTEAMGQAAGWLIAATVDFARWPLLTMIDDAKFRTLVVPGDLIRLEARLRSRHGDDFEAVTTARVDGQRVASARLLFHTFDGDGLPVSAAFNTWAREIFRALGGEALANTRAPIDATP